jgi:hypothetical protein
MPERIQLRRTKGWRMPEGAVKVDRSTKWGNHIAYICGCARDNERAAALYRCWLDDAGRDVAEAARTELRGKNLACWCRLDEPCHADVLLEYANAFTHNKGYTPIGA